METQEGVQDSACVDRMNVTAIHVILLNLQICQILFSRDSISKWGLAEVVYGDVKTDKCTIFCL